MSPVAPDFPEFTPSEPESSSPASGPGKRGKWKPSVAYRPGSTVSFLPFIEILGTMFGLSVGEEPYCFHFSLFIIIFLARFTVLVLLLRNLLTSLVCLLCKFMYC